MGCCVSSESTLSSQDALASPRAMAKDKYDAFEGSIEVMTASASGSNGMLLSDLASASHDLKQSLNQSMSAAGFIARQLKQKAYPSDYPEFKPLSLSAGIRAVKQTLEESVLLSLLP